MAETDNKQIICLGNTAYWEENEAEIADEGEERGAMGMGTHAGGQTSRESLVWERR